MVKIYIKITYVSRLDFYISQKRNLSNFEILKYAAADIKAECTKNS